MNGLAGKLWGIAAAIIVAAILAIAAFTVETSVRIERLNGQLDLLNNNLANLQVRYLEERVRVDRIEAQLWQRQRDVRN